MLPRRAWIVLAALSALYGVAACTAEILPISGSTASGSGDLTDPKAIDSEDGEAGGGGYGAEGGGSGGPAEPIEPCTADDVAVIFQASCAAGVCHQLETPGNKLSALDLYEPGLEERLLDQPAPDCEDKLLVDTSDPTRSYLLEKLEATEPTCGLPMPIGAPLEESDVACVRSWIESVANGDD